ncbi:MAG: DUF1684 domain-containing protein [Pseudomonadota bacterium]|nr:DUF1684 domain-containing protein [Pseudomonadota bacterium]
MSAAFAAEPRDQAAWTAWRAGIEAEYAADRLAILKAADVRYLKAGEMAYLSPNADGAMRFSLEPSKADILSVAYDGEKAALKRGALSFDLLPFLAEAKRYPVSDRYDLAGGKTSLEPGVEGFRIILFDQDRPAARAFKGADWFGYDEAFAVRAKFVPAADMTPRDLQTERGLWRRYYLAGHAHVKLKDGDVDLPLYAPTDDPAKIDYLFVSFTDETTGDETYGVGRYLDFKDFGPFPPKTLTVDFNRAYNPYCALSPHYNCPLALTHIPLALRAGEKTPLKD